MFNWLHRLMKDPRRPIRHGNIRLKVELLEDRLVPTLRIWDGGALFNDKWSDPKNWAGDERPSIGDDLRFPGGIGALDRTTNNDFPVGTRFNSIQFTGDDFRLSGNRIKLDAGGILSPSEAGSNIIEFDIEILNGPVDTQITPINVEGSTLLLGGSISGGGDRAQLIKQGRGTLVLAGNLPNTYIAPTFVEGTLILAKTAGVTSIPDDFDMSIRASATVLQTTSDQIGNGLRVFMSRFSQYQLLNGSNETIESVRLLGSTVDTGAGTLTLLPGPNSSGIISAALDLSSTVAGHINFANAGGFSVADGTALNDLVVTASIAGSTGKTSALGRLVLAGDSPNLLSMAVAGGNLQADGNMPNAEIRIPNGALLTGQGTVGDIEAIFGGIVSPGSPGINAVGLLTTPQLVMEGPSILHVDIGFFSNDQVHVTQRTILIDGPTLEVSANILTSPGDTFKIVDNDENPTNGFFRDALGNLLEENDTFLVGNRVFRIIYTGGPDGNDIVIQHINTGTMAPDIAVTPTTINVGQVVHLTGHLVDPDPGDRLTLRVNWGDGTTQTFHPGTELFDIEHRYRHNPAGAAQYVIHATWFDNHGGGNSRDLTVTVRNVAPELTGLEVRLERHQVFVSGRIVDPGTDSFTLVVQWGDGQTDTYPFAPGTTHFEVHHQYRDPGHYKVRLNLTDDDGGTDLESIILDFAARGRRDDAWWIALFEFLRD